VVVVAVDSNWRGAVSFTSPPLNPRGSSHIYPLDRMLVGPKGSFKPYK
jgi:hypothetical protein